MESKIKKESRDILLRAFDKLCREDYLNIKNDVSERNICARLAHHMENIMREKRYTELFEGCYADVEYNRMRNGKQKSLEDTVPVLKRMISDLLIHKRGGITYLAVEVKKNKGNKNIKACDSDRKRLKEMVSCERNLCAKLGAFVIYSKDDIKVEFYEKEKWSDVKYDVKKEKWSDVCWD